VENKQYSFLPLDVVVSPSAGYTRVFPKQTMFIASPWLFIAVPIKFRFKLEKIALETRPIKQTAVLSAERPSSPCRTQVEYQKER
jgi:hypothetical protein